MQKACLESPHKGKLVLVVLGVTSPLFPGIPFPFKPPKTLGKWLVFERTMTEKNEESTRRVMAIV